MNNYPQEICTAQSARRDDFPASWPATRMGKALFRCVIVCIMHFHIMLFIVISERLDFSVRGTERGVACRPFRGSAMGRFLPIRFQTYRSVSCPSLEESARKQKRAPMNIRTCIWALALLVFGVYRPDARADATPGADSSFCVGRPPFVCLRRQLSPLPVPQFGG